MSPAITLAALPSASIFGLPNPFRLIGQGISNFGLSLITPWVLDGTRSALQEVAHIINAATAPDVTSRWFTGEYWRVAALATMLTLPFIFAASLQALMRSEPALILKAIFGYLPLAMIGIGIATPVVMLLLSATDEMCGIVSATASTGGAAFLSSVAVKLGANFSLEGSAFFAVVVGLFTLFAALMLTLELLVREASVYIVVLMLPLAFAAMVWPARKVWAVRVVELLISLILAKFVIVSVLSLAGAALGSGDGVSPILTAMTLVMLSTLAPWALMRFLPFTEVAAAAAGGLRLEAQRPMQDGFRHGKALFEGSGGAADAITRHLAEHRTGRDSGPIADDTSTPTAADESRQLPVTASSGWPGDGPDSEESRGSSGPPGGSDGPSAGGGVGGGGGGGGGGTGSADGVSGDRPDAAAPAFAEAEPEPVRGSDPLRDQIDRISDERGPFDGYPGMLRDDLEDDGWEAAGNRHANLRTEDETGEHDG